MQAIRGENEETALISPLCFGFLGDAADFIAGA
jgi:hypothetical protein